MRLNLLCEIFRLCEITQSPLRNLQLYEIFHPWERNQISNSPSIDNLRGGENSYWDWLDMLFNNIGVSSCYRWLDIGIYSKAAYSSFTGNSQGCWQGYRQSSVSKLLSSLWTSVWLFESLTAVWTSNWLTSSSDWTIIWTSIWLLCLVRRVSAWLDHRLASPSECLTVLEPSSDYSKITSLSCICHEARLHLKYLQAWSPNPC